MAPLDELTVWRGLVELVQAEVLYQRGVPPQATYTFKHALLQEAAYQSLLKSTRQQYHQHIAQVLAAQFPAFTETQPELLAHYYTDAGLAETAVRYWQREGQKAHARAAYAEAISHLTTGLEVLKTLPDTTERTQHELDVLLTLGPAVGLVKGEASPEFEHVYVQAYALCQQLGDTPHLFAVLTGLRSLYMHRGELQTARQYGEQALALAQRLQGPVLLRQAHYTLGVALWNLGDVTSAYAHFEQGMTLADAQRDTRGRAWHRMFAGPALWFLGYPDQALQRSHEALPLAQSLDPLSVYVALTRLGHVHELRREVQAAHARFEAALALATEHGFVEWIPATMNQRGGTLAALGHSEAGIAQMRQGIAALQATQTRMALPQLLARLAAAYENSG